MSAMANSKRRLGAKVAEPPMDGLTAIAFGREAFHRLHPSLPEHFWRHATSGTIGRDPAKNYVVCFVWQRKTSRTGSERFFEVLVNAWNARTTVLLDTPLDDFRPEDFEVYEPVESRS